MNEKRAKALRSICRRVAVPAQTVYLINNRTGVIRVGKCFRGLYRSLKKRMAKGLPLVPPTPKPAEAARV
jgi:hypothetical protein